MDKELFVKDSYYLEDCEILFNDEVDIRIIIGAKLDPSKEDFTLKEVTDYAEKLVEKLKGNT